MERLSKKELIGSQPIDVLKEVIQRNPHIESVNLWTYTYVRLTTEERGNNQLWLTREDILNSNAIDNTISTLRSSEQLAISSKLKLSSGEFAHIPLMDFSIPKSPPNLGVLRERLEYSNFPSGWIFETGKSYHFWGSKLLAENEWIPFMGNCLLTSIVHDRQNIEQIADPRYIGHSQKRGCNTIRITTRADKKFAPVVVSYFNNQINKSS